MDLKKIGSFCKARKRVAIVSHVESRSVWVGDGRGMWLCDEGVAIYDYNAGSLLDIDEDKLSDMAVTASDSEADIWDSRRQYAGEDSAIVMGCGVINGDMMLALCNEDDMRLALIPLEYVKAATKKDEYRRYYLIGNRDDPTVLITDGMQQKMLVQSEGPDKTQAFIDTYGRLAGMRPYGTAEETGQTAMEL